MFMVLIMFWASKAPKELSISQTYNKKGFPDTRATRTGGCVRYSFISSNDSWQVLSQPNETPFFINLVKGWHHPERFDINLQIYTNRPCKPLSSLRFLECCIFWTTQIFSGFRWVPLDPLATPRKDLIGFIFDWWARMMSNTLFRSVRCSPLCRFFTTISST